MKNPVVVDDVETVVRQREGYLEQDITELFLAAR